jgi:hypothetical protein
MESSMALDFAISYSFRDTSDINALVGTTMAAKALSLLAILSIR